MPVRMPIHLLARTFAEQSVYAVLFGIRFVLVTCMWLGILPLVTVWTWRMYFSLGENTAWWVSDLEREAPPPTNATSFYSALTNSTTLSLLDITSHPVWKSLWADIFTGQIIASLIVVTFVSVFLLREWIAQNARPGVFEDEDDILAEANVPIPPVPALAPLPPPIVAPPPQPELPAQRQAAEWADRIADARRQLEEMRARAPGPYPIPVPAIPNAESAQTTALRGRNTSLKDRRGKGKEIHEPRLRKRPTDANGLDDDKGESEHAQFQFTFRHPPPDVSFAPSLPRRSFSEPKIQYGETSFSFSTPTSQTPTPGPSDSVPKIPRRPPLPTTTLPSPSIDGYPPLTTRSNAATPLQSPSLATYSAPEEFQPQAGPSKLRDSYFEDEDSAETIKTDDDEDNAVEYSRYFGDAEAAGAELEHDEMFYITDSEEEIQEHADDGGFDPLAEHFDLDHEHPEIKIEDNSEDEDENDEDADGPHEDLDVQDVEIRAVAANQGALLPPPPPPPPAVIPPPLPPAPAEEENDAENLEDDMEGAMEAIGLRGPLFAVIQNAALMIFILDTAIGVGVFLPFTIGKSTALLSLNPPRLLQILHLPIWIIRILTDPIVDSFMYLITRFVVPRFVFLFGLVFRFVISALSSTLGKATATKVDELCIQAKDMLDNMFMTVPDDTIVAAEAATTFELPSFMGPAEPFFAGIGKEARIRALGFYASWKSLSVGQGPLEYTFAVALGYVVIGVALALYLNVLTVGNVRSAGRAVRSTVKQQLLVVKVAGFIFIELVTFPLGCGVVLDFCAMWLLRSPNDTGVSFFAEAPLTSIFYHWVAGTFFMYSFAILLSGCRTIMRSGAMWFIKDPQDQNTHPIRDILERPTLTQMRKIVLSGFMYSFVVLCVVATVAGLLFLGRGTILPFRWKTREPLSNIPIDLLFLHFVLPYTMKYFRPKKLLKNSVTRVWKFLAHRLRLTSYFFGGRYPSEEVASPHWFSRPKNPGDYAFQGSFRRVPATDNVALGRDMRATAAVDASGQPVDEEAKKQIELQNAETEKAKGNIKTDYMVVYLPPQFRLRIIAFIAALWTIGAIFFGLAVALPILIGRGFFALFVSHEVHDGYSVLIGTYLLTVCYLISAAIDRLDKRRQRSRGDGPRADLRILIAKRGLLWLAKASYMFVTVGVLLPTLLAIVIDLYIIFPVRMAIDPQMTPRIRVVDAWAIGSLYAKIGWQVYRLQPRNRDQEPHQLVNGLRAVINNGWMRPDPIAATKDFIGPALVGLGGMIFLPAGLFKLLQHLIPFFQTEEGRTAFLQLYPTIFAVAGLFRAVAIASQLYGSWAQKIRDTEFLVEMRLRNHEPERDQSSGVKQEGGELLLRGDHFERDVEGEIVDV